MIRSIEEYITMCDWDSAKFFIFSDNVFGQLIYYSHLLPLVVSLLFALFVFFKNTKLLSTRWFLTTVVLLSVWLFSDLVLWATEKPSITMFFWSMLVLIEPIIYASMLFFVKALIDGKDLSFKSKVIVFSLLLPTVILVPTSFALVEYDLSNCWREAIEGPLAFYGYAIEVLFSIWILVFGIRKYIEKTNKNEKRNVLLISLSTVFCLLSFAMGNVIGSLLVNWEIGQYGLFGIPIFVAVLSYLTVKYHTFNVKMMGAQALVLALILLVLGILFINNISTVRMVTAVTLVLVTAAGFLLIRSVKKEVIQREQLQIISEQLFEANDKLKGLDKLKTEFLSLASHQLRSPLTAIKGYTSMLLAGDFGTVNDKQKETIDRVFESSKHLTKVVEDLLSVTKIEQGGMQYAMQPFDFEKAAKDLAMDLAITADKKGLKLTFETDNKAPYTVNGDMEKIRQVVLNLLDNSIKYTPTGSIEVKVTKDEKNKKILWSCKDTGMGIKPEIKGTLFGKFSRGDGNKLNTTGTGLGLYLAKMIVDSHKGRVWAESDGEGKGSTFLIELDAV